MSSDKVDGNLSQECKIADGSSVADPAIVFAEGDVEHPVQAVLDAPVLTNGPGENLRRVARTGQEVAELGFHLARAVDAANAFHGQDRLQAGPVPQRLQQSRLRTREYAAAYQTAVLVIEAVAGRTIRGTTGKTRIGAVLLDSPEDLALIGLEGHAITRH